MEKQERPTNEHDVRIKELEAEIKMYAFTSLETRRDKEREADLERYRISASVAKTFMVCVAAMVVTGVSS